VFLQTIKNEWASTIKETKYCHFVICLNIFFFNNTIEIWFWHIFFFVGNTLQFKTNLKLFKLQHTSRNLNYTLGGILCSLSFEIQMQWCKDIDIFVYFIYEFYFLLRLSFKLHFFKQSKNCLINHKD
jgi:hypothetical protein